MKGQNSRYMFSRAEPTDNREILEILEEGEFQGNISLQYTRRPDAYASFMREGSEVEIIICRDLESGLLVGFGVCAINYCYVNGSPKKVGYLFGLRMRKEYMRKTLLLHKAYAYLGTVLAEKNVSYYLTSILTENQYAQKLLNKKRMCIPSYQHFTDYQVFTLKTATYRGNTRYQFREAKREDIPNIVDFLTIHGKCRDFFPIVTESDLLPESSRNISYKDMYLLTDQGRIVACGACWDQESTKQYIVKRYGGVYRYLQPISFIFPLLGYPALPPENSQLRFFTLSYWCIEDDDPRIFDEFVNRMSGLSKYPYFNIGITKESPFAALLVKRKHFLYNSKMYFVSWSWNETGSVIKGLKNIYLECGKL